jgi:hypothetical protein
MWEVPVKFALPVLALVSPLVFANPAAAQEPQGFSVTPYVWLPNIDGGLTFQIPSGLRARVQVGPSDYLENLDMALMLGGQYRGAGWTIFGDVIYLDFSNEGSAVRTVSGPGPIQIPFDTGSQVNFKGMLGTVGIGYQAVNEENFTLDAFGGARYLGAEAQLNWSLSGPLNLFPQSGSVEAEEDIWDGIVGVRGEGRIGHWFVPYYIDAGAGSSELTYQFVTGVGYRFGGWDARLLYRKLFYDEGEDGLVENLSFSGPVLGATFRF